LRFVSLFFCAAWALAGAVYFEPNRGQSASSAPYFGHVREAVVEASPDSIAFGGKDGRVDAIQFMGADAHATATEGPRLHGVSHYVRGSDPSHWVWDVPRLATVSYRGVYRGIDLIYRAGGDNVEFDFQVQPFSNPAGIRMLAPPHAAIDSSGSLSFNGTLLRAPRAWQQIGGRRYAVPVRFVLAGRQLTFQLGHYDRSSPLTIDPLLVFATFLGGSGADIGRRVTVGPDGAIYVGGDTMSSDFPASLPSADPSLRPGMILEPTIFLTRMKSDGSGLDWSLYVGGSARQTVFSLKLDPFGNLFLLGNTTSPDFPVTSNAWKATIDPSLTDLFLAKFDAPSGHLLAATFLGTALYVNQFERAASLAIDGAGGVYVGGAVLYSGSLTATSGAFQTAAASNFAMRLNAGLTAPVYVTFWNLGSITAMDVDSSGYLWIGGAASSVTPLNPLPGFNQSSSGYAAAYLSRLNPTGTALTMASLVAGNGSTAGISDIRVAADGSVYTVGYETGPGFPQVQPLAIDPLPANYPAQPDNFVASPFLAHLAGDGSAILQSTVFYGPSYSAQIALPTTAFRLVFPSPGQSCIMGFSYTGAIQTPGALLPAPQFPTFASAALTCADPAATQLSVKTLLPATGGSYLDSAAAPDGSVVFTGGAQSALMATPGVFQPAYAGSVGFVDYYGTNDLVPAGDAFVIRVSLNNPAPSIQGLTPDTLLLDTANLSSPCTAAPRGSGFAYGASGTVNGIQGSWGFADAADGVLTFPCSALLAGDNQIAITNPAPGGGTATFTLHGINAPPSTISVSPSLAAPGAAETKLVIRARNLAAGSILFWNGAPRAASLVADGTPATTSHFELLLDPPELAQPSSNTIAVSNPAPGGGMSATVTFAVQPAGAIVPVLATPPTLLFGVPGSPLGPQVSFGGSGIAANASAFWDGVSVPVISAAGTSIRIQPPAADLQTVGSHSLYLMNGTVASSPVRVIVGPYLYSQPQPLSAYDPATGHLYLCVHSTSAGPWDLLVMSAQTGATLSSVAGIVNNLHAMALSANGQYLYLADAATATAGAPILRYNTAAGKVDLQWSLPVTTPGGTAASPDVTALATPAGSPGALIVSQSNGVATIFDGATPRLFDSTIAAPTLSSIPLLFAGSSRVYIGGPSCWEWLDFDAFGFSGGQTTCGSMPSDVRQLGGVLYATDGARAAAFSFPGAAANTILNLAVDPVALHAWSLGNNQSIDYNMATGTMQTTVLGTSGFPAYNAALYPAGDGSVILIGLNTFIRVP
jgi:hypothetical protein